MKLDSNNRFNFQSNTTLEDSKDTQLKDKEQIEEAGHLESNALLPGGDHYAAEYTKESAVFSQRTTNGHLKSPGSVSQEKLMSPSRPSVKVLAQSSQKAKEFAARALSRKQSEKIVPYPASEKMKSGGDANPVSGLDDDSLLDEDWAKSIQQAYQSSKALFGNKAVTQLPEIPTENQLDFMSGEGKKAQEITTSLSLPSSGGTWQMGAFLEKMLSDLIQGSKNFGSENLLSRLQPNEATKEVFTQIKSEIGFMQQIRTSAITAQAHAKAGRLNSKSYDELKKHIALDILSKLRIDGSVLVPVDFIPSPSVKSDEENQVMDSHSSLAFLTYESNFGLISMSFFETTGRYSQAYVNAEEIRAKAAKGTLKEDLEQQVSLKNLLKAGGVSKTSLGRSLNSGRLEKSFSKMSSKRNILYADIEDSDSEKFDTILTEVSSWLNIEVGSDPATYEHDILNFSKTLDLRAIE